ncbi:hypothetical protein GCM10011515_07200 [Tsuneonella deserti]|uniref:Ankyrin repeats (3 copies) n=1 Tax=Tsuneonella deserti TaxID=2035528 RepID=A0ABQ1S4I0_9SPHN|nr:ankyrin repeat domain-containing protein [Tsuneonella deserti]GGD90155.1 hypothetical protein GCM10011515_07200 [Tsuneonella deserti]
MKKLLAASALALAVIIGGQSVAPIATPAIAQADAFENAHHYVVNKMNAQALEIIDRGDFPIDQGNYEGWTMLHYAAESGNLEMVKALLERGADPTLATQWGTSAYDVGSTTLIKAAIAAAIEARTGVNPVKPAVSARPSSTSAAAAPVRASASAKPGKTQTAREKMCEGRWYSSNALCSDSTCKMREYRKWQTCLKTGSYY